MADGSVPQQRNCSRYPALQDPESARPAMHDDEDPSGPAAELFPISGIETWSSNSIRRLDDRM